MKKKKQNAIQTHQVNLWVTFYSTIIWRIRHIVRTAVGWCLASLHSLERDKSSDLLRHMFYNCWFEETSIQYSRGDEERHNVNICDDDSTHRIWFACYKSSICCNQQQMRLSSSLLCLKNESNDRCNQLTRKLLTDPSDKYLMTVYVTGRCQA